MTLRKDEYTRTLNEAALDRTLMTFIYAPVPSESS